MNTEKDSVAIVVNGREKLVSKKELSPDGEITFDQVVSLAFSPPPSGPDIIFTVSYRNSAERIMDGRLLVGKSVKVKEGTIFIATFTDKS